ncbi:MAG: response regulator [Planctomycetota bacterium]
MLLDLYRLFERHSPDRFRLSPVEQRPAQILVAEDSPFFQNLIRSYLEHPPRRLTVVSDGLEALEMLQAHPDEFDVLISDIEMPRMDGFELVKRIRSDPVLRTLPVIAVTSLATPEHVERGLREGFDSYLIKIDKEQLVTTLDRHLERGAKHRATLTGQRKEE